MVTAFYLTIAIILGVPLFVVVMSFITLVAKTKKQEQRMAPGLDGGVVMFGQRTSKMKVVQMVEVIEAIYWFGTEHGVQFSEKSKLEIEWAKRWGERHE